MRKPIIPALLALIAGLSLGGCEAWNALFAKHSGKTARYKGRGVSADAVRPATAGEYVASEFGAWVVDDEDITGDTIRVLDGKLEEGTVIHCVHGF